MRVIGHRGAAAVAPENTLASFARAIEAGVRAVECDARLTLDGAVVLMHDDDVSRTTNASGRISEMTLEQVRALDAAAGWELWRGAGLQVPTLGELLELIDGRADLVIELKADWDDRGFRSATPVARAVAPIVSGVAGVILSSFDPAAVSHARAVAPGTPTALSILRGFPIDEGIRTAREAGHVEIHPAQDAVDAATVRRAHEAGLAVCCWTVNDVARARELEAASADAIFADDPVAMAAALA
ncbi:MAG TPA: glycerophosphodiester phosphodiesterase family protein [Actinomycetota bacterium]